MKRSTFMSLVVQCNSNPLLDDLLSCGAEDYVVDPIIDVGVCKIAISAKAIRYEFEPSEIQPFVKYLWKGGFIRPKLNEFKQRLMQIHNETLEKLTI